MRNVIISDFDETITKKDTIGIIGHIPYSINAKLEPKWLYFVDNYMNGWEKYQREEPKRQLPLCQYFNDKIITRDNFFQLFNDELQYEIYNRRIELYSIDELVRQNHFKGLTEKNVRDYVDKCMKDRTVEIRPGFKSFIEENISGCDDFYILSLNWSKEFVQRVINSSKLKDKNIYCNGLKLVDGVYDGSFPNDILTGSDKIKYLKEVIEKTSNVEDTIFWYIGDSVTDLLSILHPCIQGILLIDPNENLKKFYKMVRDTLGVPEELISKFMRDDINVTELPINKENDNKVYLVKSWIYINELMK